MRLLNGIYSTILSATAEKVYAAKQKEHEIRQLMAEPPEAIYTPPVIENGVMVQMGIIRCASFGTTGKCNDGIKWYEDKFVC